MALTKDQKKKVIKDLQDKLSKQKSMVFVDFAKVNSKDIFALRKELKEAGCNLKISKKTLLGLAFGKEKSEIWKKIKENASGQLAVAFGFEDELAPARLSNKFAKSHENLKILGGTFENEFISIEKVLSLASIPTRNELLGRLVGSLYSPVASFVRVLDKIRESKEKATI